MSDRIRIEDSPGRVVVTIGDVQVADSDNAKVLFETGLDPRCYIPREDVSLDLFEQSESSTTCPFKGAAKYWSFRAEGHVFEDIVWSYESPIPEAADIAGLLCFYDNKPGVQQVVS